MRHRRNRTKDILKEVRKSESPCAAVIDDVYCSANYLDAVDSGDIRSRDTVLIFSIDGAQLYSHKASDVWIWIWVLLDLPPELRYQKEYVIPAAIIPGPNKPKNLDSFLFVGLHHIAALQKDGLRIWDAIDEEVVESDIWVHIGGADGPGSAQVSGLVPHNGVRGCRLRCSVIGRRKEGGTVYYPVLLKPRDYNVANCNHDDIPARSVTLCSHEDYMDDLVKLLSCETQAEYNALRKETGICKPSILMGLWKVIPPPLLFPSDLMHLTGLNIPDLFLGLWRGNLDCDDSDSKAAWDWATLKGDAWIKHGQDVAACAPHLPGIYGDAPRNIAEKVSSGYKASEFDTWFYVYGPALLYGCLPQVYWQHACKLILAVRLAHLRSITIQQVQLLDEIVISFYEEFEKLYYRRHPGRIHFVRQSMHALLHIALMGSQLS